MRLDKVVISAALSLFVAGCAAGETQSTAPIAVEFDPAQVALPREYSRYNEASETLEVTPLDWSLARSGEPTDDSCAGERGWLWAHDRGDPRIWLFMCPASSTSAAQAIVEDTSLEALFVESLEGIYAAEPVSTDAIGLQADLARLACAWGPPHDCRGWIFLAQYGSHVVNIQFAVSGHGGILEQAEFVAVVESIDEQMAAAIAPVP